MPHKLPEDRREYMRNWMRNHRANETSEEHARRLKSEAQYQRRRYRKVLRKLGLDMIGKGHRRRWKF
jgi:hypothetical protein